MPKSKPQTSTMLSKPPVVAILGHVDHGKTTLLDKIRNSRLTSVEHGGITQNIGAYQIDFHGQKITFIDTPGHAAFSKMRAHGARVTDIAILVIAANDGVKPQTKESIRHIQEAEVPLIVAINKMDIKGASAEMVKAQLVEEGVQVEGYGGSVPVIEISALQGTHVDKLLETILILSELEGFSASASDPLEAVVIGSHQQKNLGPIATMLIKTGTLRLQDKLVSVTSSTPVTGTAKRLLSDVNQPLTQVTPGTPVEVLGLKSVPQIGTIFTTLGSQHQISVDTPSLPIPQETPPPQPEEPVSTPEVITDTDLAPDSVSVDDQPVSPPINIKIILLSDSVGTLEAITQNIGDEIELIKTGTGQVTESDILLAQSTGAAIIAFNVPIKKSARKLAEIERVPLKSYNIIYQLLEDLENQVLKLLEPTIDEEELGVATVKATFNIKDSTVAGCQVVSGHIPLNSKIHLKRGTRFLTDATVASLKHGKQDVTSAKAGTECGIITKPKLDIKVGDQLIAFRKQTPGK